MGLTGNYKYTDNDGDWIEVEGDVGRPLVKTSDEGAYVGEAESLPLALNVLGYDLDEEDRLADNVSVEDAVVIIAQTPMLRDFQLRHAAALLKAVIAFDKRAVRLAAAEKRREAAAQALTDAVIRLRNDGPGAFTGDEIGKLREALGRYDASLAN